MMKNIYFILALLISAEASAKTCSPLLSFNPGTLNDNTLANIRESYQGEVILIVNTASKCTYTDQYSALEKLYREYRHESFVVAGFASNNFDQQEPAKEEEIQSSCRLIYGVEFPVLTRTHVYERNVYPIYTELAAASGSYPKWNFHEYLIDRNGELVTDYISAIDPMDELFIQELRKQVRKF